MTYDLAGRTVLVTGACGGLGVALAEALRAKGARLALVDLDADHVTDRARRLGDQRAAAGWAADVRDLDRLIEVAASVRAHFGRFDVVVAAAGVLGPLTALGTTREADWQRVVDVNLGGVWRTFKATAPHVTEVRGHMLALSSMIGFIHPPLLGSYAASKAGVWALCDSLRLELRGSGVTVGSVHPIIFRTPMIGDALESPAASALVRDFTGVFAPVPLPTVVEAVVRGIERRSAHVVTPRRVRPAARAAGLAQAALERIHFRPRAISEAVRLGSLPDQPRRDATTPS
ncbi:SDR family NAD(P)-dependent oxidoreductase [Actinomycetospora sp. NBRC 106378]|uniref:SDR family NAD(P)-dependent oxidoreductase n=1 Tax=Actinomycetospora sp. NBRC 106378 TaxID=3032208 RepID=UPI0024A27EEC|nr:SDR family NAD(P)-dependent oxidoreductase [Actinomycetospora sp. NBRC 106378]GLZ53477.1 short-chain dehydrogenase [Actinomycetospora sp. NBRC 106378]